MKSRSLLTSLVGFAILLIGFGSLVSAQPPAPQPPTTPMPEMPEMPPDAATRSPEDTRPTVTPAESPDKSNDPGTSESPFDWKKFRLGGQYRVEPNASNFTYHPLIITDTQDNQAFINQRLRLWLTYNPTEHVEGYVQIQIGGFNWGTNFDFPKNFAGDFTSLPDDRVGVQLRRAWLAVSDDCWGRCRAGILDWHDSFKDTLASSDYDFDIGGVDWVKVWKEYNDLRASAAILLLSDQGVIFGSGETNPGPHSAWLYAIDVDQPLGDKKTSIGGSIYYIDDHGQYSYPTLAYSFSWDLWVGIRGKTEIGDFPVNGFIILNTGDRSDYTPTSFHHTGWAATAEVGPVPVWCGKLSAQVVGSSGGPSEFGNSSQFRTVAQTARDNFGAQGYWSYMHLTTPNGPDDVNDLGVGLQNRGLGLFTVQAKYEVPLCKKLSSCSSVGWFRSMVVNPVSGSSNIGTELAEDFTYDFGGGMKLDFGAAVLFTGDFYRAGPNGPTPETLYEAFARFQLEF